ncbi:enoyl-CoA hydratase/isomerase family protein [Methylobacterium sp. A54F]
MTDAIGTDEIIVERVGRLGRIRLNRPRALNALTLDMVHAIGPALAGFAEDPAIAAVLLTGEGERGLCAGGDLRALYEGSAEEAATFWRDEYRLDAGIARYAKPFVAVMDGITMGGGIGLSGHARHRLVTERSRIAMPETGIGFIPDVGGTWLLPRAPGELGTYLGLTGEAVGAADAILCGLADTLVPVSALPALAEALAALPRNADHAAVQAVIDAHAQVPGPAPLAAHRALIDRCFASDDVAGILAALDADGSDFARAAAASLRAKAPAALVFTLRLLRLGRDAPTLEACLERELHACLAVLAEGDLREGIRSVVIDKDRAFRWNPATLEAVDPARIDRWLSERRTAPAFPAAHG